MCGGCGCGGRKKREIGHVKGHLAHRDNDQEWNNQCNSLEFSDVIVKVVLKHKQLIATTTFSASPNEIIVDISRFHLQRT